MSVRDALTLELRVAFSRKAQSIRFRVLKWTVLLAVGAYLWRGSHFWWWVGGALGFGLTLHLVWRWKTKRWTRAWGGWSDLDAARGFHENVMRQVQEHDRRLTEGHRAQAG